jgi:hypothetical protein
MRFNLAATAIAIVGFAASSSATSSVTTVVSEYTTYISAATTLTIGDNAYTVTAPETLTITDCPCTVVLPVVSVKTISGTWYVHESLHVSQLCDYTLGIQSRLYEPG